MASAKLAKITVRNSQTVIDQANRVGVAMASMKVTTVPTSTTNMTGFLTCTRGSSFLKASMRARPRISRSNRLRASATPWATGRGRLSGCEPAPRWVECVHFGSGHQKNFP